MSLVTKVPVGIILGTMNVNNKCLWVDITSASSYANTYFFCLQWFCFICFDVLPTVSYSCHSNGKHCHEFPKVICQTAGTSLSVVYLKGLFVELVDLFQNHILLSLCVTFSSRAINQQ